MLGIYIYFFLIYSEKHISLTMSKVSLVDKKSKINEQTYMCMLNACQSLKILVKTVVRSVNNEQIVTDRGISL